MFLTWFMASCGCVPTPRSLSGAHPGACGGAGWNPGAPQCSGIRQERRNEVSVAMADSMSQCCFGADGLASATNVGSAKRRGRWGQSTRSPRAWNESLLALKATERGGKRQTERDGDVPALDSGIWIHPDLIGVRLCSAESCYPTTVILIRVIKLLYLRTFNLLCGD